MLVIPVFFSVCFGVDTIFDGVYAGGDTVFFEVDTVFDGVDVEGDTIFFGARGSFWQ